MTRPTSGADPLAALRQRLEALELADAADTTDWRDVSVKALDREATQRARRASIRELRGLVEAGVVTKAEVVAADRVIAAARAYVAYYAYPTEGIDPLMDEMQQALAAIDRLGKQP